MEKIKGESIFDAARRELHEETGALDDARKWYRQQDDMETDYYMLYKVS